MDKRNGTRRLSPPGRGSVGKCVQRIARYCGRHPLLVLTLLMALTLLVVFYPFIFQHKMFIYGDIGSDTENVYYPFYLSLAHKMGQQDFSLWNFQDGMGRNMLSHQTDLGSVFTWIACLSGVTGIKYALGYLQILKILLSGFLCWRYLSFFSFSKPAKVLTSYIYAFNGFLMLWGQHYFFGNAGIDLMLMLLSIERSFVARRGYAFTALATFLVLCNSYYLGYMILLFSGIYALFRCLHRYHWSEVKAAAKQLGGLLASVLIGGCMSAFLFLPSVAVVLGTSSRISSDVGLVDRLLMGLTNQYDSETFLGILSRMFSNNLMGSNDFTGPMNYYELPQYFFTGLNCFVLLLFVFELVLRWREQKKRSVLYCVELLLVGAAVLNPFLSLILNGFVSSFFRFTFLLMPLLALCYARIFDRLIQKTLKYAHFEISAACFISVTLLAAVIFKTNTSSRDGELTGMLCLLVIVGFSLAALYLQTVKGTGPARTLCLMGMAALVLFNITWESYMTTCVRTLSSDIKPFLYAENPNEEVAAALAELNEDDGSFFRVEKTFSDVAIYNDSQVEGYFGISSYNSVQNSNVVAFVEEFCPELILGPASHYHRFAEMYDNVEIASLLGVKYIFSYDDLSGIPEYEHLADYGKMKVYRNTGTDSIGRFYTDAVSYDQYRAMGNPEQLDLRETLILRELAQPVTAEETGASRVTVERTENSSRVEGTVEAAQDGWVFLAVPYEAGWSAYVDGRETELLQADVGFMALAVDQGTHTVSLQYRTPYLNEGIFISCLGAAAFAGWCILLFHRTKKERAAQ